MTRVLEEIDYSIKILLAKLSPQETMHKLHHPHLCQERMHKLQT